MPLKTPNPKTPGTRGAALPSFEEITRSKPEKSLLRPLKNTAGRNNRGKITTRHRGGGSKRMYRVIDFKRDKVGIPGKVASIEYDPNRSARIALVHYADGEKRYILAPLGLRVGTKIESGPRSEIKPANTLPLRNIPAGTLVHNLEIVPGKGGQLVRSAGGRRAGAVEGRLLRAHTPSLRRGAESADRLPGHHRPAQQRRPQKRQAGQGRQNTLPGPKAPGAWRRHEPK